MALEEEFSLREDVPLAPLTTMGVGGRARYLATCRSSREIRACLVWARTRGLRVQILGGGSNTVFADAGYDGVVVRIDVPGAQFEEAGESVVARVGAGEDWDGLVQRACERGLAGIECLSGIPGLVGASPVQNVGAYGQEVEATLVALRALDRATLETVELTNRECRFGYRQSRFKHEDRDRYVIEEVSFRLRRDGRPQLRYAELTRHLEQRLDPAELGAGPQALGAVREAVLALRRRKSMVVDAGDPEARSAGSFFLNPVLTPREFEALQGRWGAAGGHGAIPVFDADGGVKVAAAWLVEQSGFQRGWTRGGAGISTHHALSLVNRGGTAGEILELAAEIERRVAEVFGVRLEREPVVVAPV